MKYLYKQRKKLRPDSDPAKSPTNYIPTPRTTNTPNVNVSHPITNWNDLNPSKPGINPSILVQPPPQEMKSEPSEDVYCVCRRGSSNGFMIGCDYCEEWFHGICIGIGAKEGGLIEKYACDQCRKNDPSLQITYVKKRSRDLIERQSNESPEYQPHLKKRKLNEDNHVKVSQNPQFPVINQRNIHVAPPPPLKENEIPNSLIRCNCGSRKNFTKSAMTICDECQYWFHDMCLGIIRPDMVKTFVCKNCIIKRNTRLQMEESQKKSKKRKKKKNLPTVKRKKPINTSQSTSSTTTRKSKGKTRGRGRGRKRGRGRGRGRKK